MKIFIACALHNQGATFFTDHTEKGVKEQVAGWCVENWNKAWGELVDAWTTQDIIETYFSPEYNGDRESVVFGDDEISIS